MIYAWMMFKHSEVPISFFKILGMKLRRTLKKDLIHAIIKSYRANLEFSFEQLEAHYLAGGNVRELVDASIVLKRNNITYNSIQLCALDLAKRNLLEFIRAFMNAKKTYPSLEIDEFVQRYFKGEDVIKVVNDGLFIPWKDCSGWRVRVEYGPMSYDELSDKLKQGIFSKDCLVSKPNESNWTPISELEQLYK